jgi:hypothetical protein
MRDDRSQIAEAEPTNIKVKRMDFVSRFSLMLRVEPILVAYEAWQSWYDYHDAMIHVTWGDNSIASPDCYR